MVATMTGREDIARAWSSHHSQGPDADLAAGLRTRRAGISRDGAGTPSTYGALGSRCPSLLQGRSRCWEAWAGAPVHEIAHGIQNLCFRVEDHEAVGEVLRGGAGRGVSRHPHDGQRHGILRGVHHRILRGNRRAGSGSRYRPLAAIFRPQRRSTVSSMPNTNGSVDEPRRPATSSNSARLSCSGDQVFTGAVETTW